MAYFTDDLNEAKIYNCRVKSKITKLKNWVEQSYQENPTEEDIAAGTRLGRRVYLRSNGYWASSTEPFTYLTDSNIKTAKLYEVMLDIKEL